MDNYISGVAVFLFVIFLPLIKLYLIHSIIKNLSKLKQRRHHQNNMLLFISAMVVIMYIGIIVISLFPLGWACVPVIGHLFNLGLSCQLGKQMVVEIFGRLSMY